VVKEQNKQDEELRKAQEAQDKDQDRIFRLQQERLDKLQEQEALLYQQYQRRNLFEDEFDELD